MGNAWSYLPGWLGGRTDEEDEINGYVEDDKHAGIEATTSMEAVLTGHRLWMEAYEKKDFNAICRLYSRDCKICPAGTRTAYGRQECAMGWQSLTTTGINKVTFSNTQVESSNDEAVTETSTYHLIQDDKEIDQGKHIMIWRHHNKKWYIHIHMFSSTNPREKTPMILVSEACMRWELAYYNRDFTSINKMYTETTSLCPPAWPKVEGQVPVERFWARFPSMGVDHVERLPINAEEMGPGHLVSEVRYTMFDYRNGVIDIGKSVMIFVLSSDNRWCIHTEIFNSDSSLPSVSTEDETFEAEPIELGSEVGATKA